MEAIWDDLCQRAEEISSPDWHGAILKERAAALERGEDHLEAWETAKDEIKKKKGDGVISF